MADTTHKRRHLNGKKQMAATAMTLLFTAAVLGIGFLAPYWMEKLVPSYLETQIVTDKADVIGPVLAVSGDISQYLQPWNIYEESKLQEITEEDRQIIWSVMDSIGLFSMLLNTNDTDFSGFFNELRVMHEETGRYYYLRDWEVSVEGNGRWKIDCALNLANDNYIGLSYLRIRPVRKESITQEQINRTYQHLVDAAKLLTYIQSDKNTAPTKGEEQYAEVLPNLEVDSVLEETLNRYWNYLQEMTDILLKAQAMTPYDSFALLRSSNFTILANAEILRTDAEVLVIYRVYTGQLILFVDPLTEEYTGFSLQM